MTNVETRTTKEAQMTKSEENGYAFVI